MKERFHTRLLAILVGWGLALQTSCIVVLPEAEALLSRHQGELTQSHEEPAQTGEHYVDQEVRLESSRGLTVEMTVRVPLLPSDSPRPAVLLVGGHRTGREAARLVSDSHGAVVAALSYPTRIRKIRDLDDFFAVRRGITDTPAAISLAMDYLRERAEVDPERIELVGVSLGAPFVCVAGSRDPRFRRVWAIHGGGSPERLLAHALREEIGWAPLRRWVARSLTLASLATLLAPEDWVAGISPRPFVMVNARGDERIPAECVELLYAAAREPKELLWIDGNHVDPDETQLVQDLCDLVLERVVGESPK